MPQFLNNYAMGGLQPTIDDEAVYLAVRMAPNLTNFPAGGALAETTVVANQVHTIASLGMTAGSFHFLFNGYSSVVLTKDSTLAQVQAALDAIYGAGKIVVTGTTDVKGANLVLTWSGAAVAGIPYPLPVIVADTTIVGATLAVTNTTTGSSLGTMVPYVTGGANGSGTAKMLNKYKLSTDAGGNITFGETASGEEFGQTRQTAVAYIAGTFMTEDLPQAGQGVLDATGAAQLGRIVRGGLAVGLLRIG